MGRYSNLFHINIYPSIFIYLLIDPVPNINYYCEYLKYIQTFHLEIQCNFIIILFILDISMEIYPSYIIKMRMML